MKTLKIIVYTIFVIVMTILIEFIIASIYFEDIPAEKNTKFTSNFTKEKFYSIQFGESKSHVDSLLGRPFESHGFEVRNNITDCMPNDISFYSRYSSQIDGTEKYSLCLIYFNSDSLVVCAKYDRIFD